ncbi:hypothetical protein [Aeoliella sp. SH292]|uniref:hypothetical protein n=1 Tax=Aeoliella sp. SH292 TaxID=3454464 RepID=UPI003F964C5D
MLYPAFLRSISGPAITGVLLLMVLALSPAHMSSAAATDAVENPTAEPVKWTTPAAEDVEATLVEWIAESSATPEEASRRELAIRPKLDMLFTPTDRLDAVMACLADEMPAVAQLVEACRNSPIEATSLDWLDSADIDYWVRNNVRLYVGRALVRHHYYEQALSVMNGLAPDDVFDPASLLFYRSVAEHQLVRIDEANITLASLLDAEQEMPERFAQVARLMRADITKVKVDSLNHIARRMSDVERRLSLSEADEKTQEVERGILASLDKVIEQLEQQQQQQQQQQQAGSQPSGEPMDDSKIAEQRGEGKVDPKDIGDGSGWGNMPPRERERVLQQIGRDFPGHYRDLMEEYLKRLATDERDEE